MAIVLNLDQHCIETEAKNEFRRLMDSYFESDDSNIGKIEKNIDLLGRFLAESDFSYLRSSDIRLSGEIKSRVSISENDNGKIEISFINID